MRRVVVTGMGTINPIGNDVQSFWDGIINGKNGIDEIKSFESDDSRICLAAELKGFDALDYFPKSEIRKHDPFTQYAVAASEQAVNDSGIVGNIDPERLGVYIGSGIGGIQIIVNQSYRLFEGKKRLSPYLIPSMITNMASGVVAIRYNAQGPTLPIVTACATGGHIIGEAFRAIKAGHADAIIAGGSEAPIAEFSLLAFLACRALSTNKDPETASRPFDKDRDGFVIGEGAGTLVLEEYEHAKKRGAKIYAEITGYGNTCDAYHMTSPLPDGAGIARAITMAMEEADVKEVNENVYVNAHGTSTKLNDVTETRGFKKAFGEENAHKVAISSTKSMTGHLLGATGIVEAIACIETLNTGIAPPTIHLKNQDEECDLNYIPNEAIERPFDIAISDNLGFGGHNSCIVIKKWGGE